MSDAGGLDPDLQAVVFDFDLTLADSTDAIVACIRHAAAVMGLEEVDEARARATVGLSLETTLTVLTGIDDAAARAAFRRHFVAHADEVMVATTEMLPGAVECIDRLRGWGVRIGVASTKYRYRIEAIVDRHGIRDRFDHIVGGEDVTAYKPDPEGLVLALRGLGADAASTVYVGDHHVDAACAHAASVPFVGVLTGTTPESRLREYPCRTVLPSVVQLPDWLRPSPREKIGS